MLIRSLPALYADAVVQGAAVQRAAELHRREPASFTATVLEREADRAGELLAELAEALRARA